MFADTSTAHGKVPAAAAAPPRRTARATTGRRCQNRSTEVMEPAPGCRWGEKHRFTGRTAAGRAGTHCSGTSRRCSTSMSRRTSTTIMTRTIAARVAGFTFLFYIVVGISSMAGAFRGLAAELAMYAQNASAVILALTLFVVTRVEQPVV